MKKKRKYVKSGKYTQSARRMKLAIAYDVRVAAKRARQIGTIKDQLHKASAPEPKDIHLQNDYDSLYRECGQKDKLLDVLQKERDDIMNEHNHCLALIDQLTKKCARLQSIVSAFIEGRL